MVDLGGAGLDDLMERTRTAIMSFQALQANRPVPPDAHGEALTAGGKVKVTATGVRISGIELDPGVMSRMRVEDLARHLMDAVNGALDAAAASADGGGTDDNGAEVADLAEQVTQIQLQGARQMAAINDAVQMMLQQVKEKA